MSLPGLDTEWDQSAPLMLVRTSCFWDPPNLPDPASGLVAGDAGAVDSAAADTQPTRRHSNVACYYMPILHILLLFFFLWIVSSTMETAKSLQCPFCTETRGSRHALNQHISWHRHSQNLCASEETTNDVRRVVLKDTEATTIVEPTACAEGRGTSALRDPLVASSSSSPTSHLEKKRQYRKLVDAAVLRLKQQHQRDRTTLARPTEVSAVARWGVIVYIGSIQ